MSVNLKQNGALIKGAGLYNSGFPFVYSSEEQVVGVWLDNSTIFQKSWDFGNSPLSIPTQAWTNTSISKSGIGTIVGVEGVNADGAVWDILGARASSSSSNYVQLYSTRNTAITLKYLTLRYTKTS